MPLLASPLRNLRRLVRCGLPAAALLAVGSQSALAAPEIVFKETEKSMYLKLKDAFAPDEEVVILRNTDDPNDPGGGKNFWRVDLFTLKNDTPELTVTGVVQHIIRPDGEIHIKDKMEGESLGVDVLVNEAFPSEKQNGETFPPDKPKYPIHEREDGSHHTDKYLAYIRRNGLIDSYYFTLSGYHLGGAIRDFESGVGGNSKDSSDLRLPTQGGMQNQLAPGTSALNLGLSDFASLDFEKQIHLFNNVVAPDLVDFDLGLEFVATADPELFDVVVTAFNFEFAPFALPGTPFASVNRQVISPLASSTGVWDVGAGYLSFLVDTEWYDTGNTLIARTEQSFDFQISLGDMGRLASIDDIVGASTFTLIPEPGTITLMTAAGIGFGAMRRRGRNGSPPAV